MNTLDEFVSVIRDELGLPVTVDDASRGFDELPGWDSVHLVWLLSVLERRTGRSVSLPDVLEARDLAGIYSVVSAA
ncbi:acyl carrier protein [Streptomyces sp. NRRL F-5123]|uniref:acyl carrier protein n=1 Tax=Streptomyces sp. NRRL F-5123 TaxID=1463856 RepID=UPI0004E15B67|nr:acyl carrier protein [Streptomyces sp. NRRL F-5123]